MQPPQSDSPFRHRPQLLAGEDLPPMPQQERSRLKREALLRAGLALFAECGFEATTIEAVAQRAGVAVGGFYQHFRSKRQLLLVLMDGLVAEISGIDMALVFAPDSDPTEVLEGLVRLGLSIDWAYAGVHRAWAEAIVQDAELQKFHQEIEDWTATLAQVIIEAIAALPGARKDLELKSLSWIITLLFWKLAGRVQADSSSVDVEPVVRSLVHLLYHTLFEDNRR